MIVKITTQGSSQAWDTQESIDDASILRRNRHVNQLQTIPPKAEDTDPFLLL